MLVEVAPLQVRHRIYFPHPALRRIERDRPRRSRAISTAGVQKAFPTKPAPHDHFTAGPDCGMKVSARGRVGRAGGGPIVGVRIVSPARVQIARSTPDDHFTAGPDCRVMVSPRRRVGGADGGPTVCIGRVFPTRIKDSAAMITAPDDHFTAGPDCRGEFRMEGALVLLVSIQLFVTGLYLPPVFTSMTPPFDPPQTIISVPVHTAVCASRAKGALTMVVVVQLSAMGLYPPPVLKTPEPACPAQTIISLPVHTAVCPDRAGGVPVVAVAVQLFVPGLYRPPVFK